jgi:hypothetical protein
MSQMPAPIARTNTSASSITQGVRLRYPVNVDKNLNVIAGHGRILAAKEEGITEVLACARETPDRSPEAGLHYSR